MKLTDLEKNMLDNIVTDIFENACATKETLSYNDILRQVTFDCTLQSAVASVRRIIERTHYQLIAQQNETDHKIKTFKVIKPSVIIARDGEFIKDKNILTFATTSGTLTYDFITKTFNYDIHSSDVYDTSGYICYFNTMSNYEWLFNYTTDLSSVYDIITRCDKETYEKMPQGLYQWLQENEYDLTARTLNKYVTVMKYGRAGYNIRESFDRATADYILKKITIKELNKIIAIDVKNGLYHDIYYNIKNLVEWCRRLEQLEENYSLEELLDTNRGLSENIKRLKNLMHENKNKLLEKQLQKLNFINHLTFGEYEVIVPQNQADKQAEGKMQHNCVGYFYDDSIIEGRNLIYFLRRKEDITKSFVTCRYNINNRDTVEYRKINNTAVRETEIIAIIKKITDIINAQLV